MLSDMNVLYMHQEFGKLYQAIRDGEVGKHAPQSEWTRMGPGERLTVKTGVLEETITMKRSLHQPGGIGQGQTKRC